jgi:uncharacterized protein
VSGLSSSLAKAVVSRRDANGPFTSRQQLRDIPRLGPKAFEQCAGFLRINKNIARHPLDASGVHPESYGIVERMAADTKRSVSQLIGQSKDDLLRQFNLNQYITSNHLLCFTHQVRLT